MDKNKTFFVTTTAIPICQETLKLLKRLLYKFIGCWKHIIKLNWECSCTSIYEAEAVTILDDRALHYAKFIELYLLTLR